MTTPCSLTNGHQARVLDLVFGKIDANGTFGDMAGAAKH